MEPWKASMKAREDQENKSVPFLNNGENKLIRTPCMHYYHLKCLNEWMSKKLECPKCRKVLPILDQSDL